LDGQHRILHGKTDTNTEEDLEPVQMLDRGAIFDSIQQAGSDGDENGTSGDDVLESTDEWDDPRGGDENDDLGEDEWEESNTRIGSREIVGGLHSDREVVDLKHERRE
jgi:hypothetical protein